MITYQIDHNPNRVTCRVSLSLRVLDVGQFLEQLFADPTFDARHNVLVLVDADTVTPDIIARNALAQLLLSWRNLHVAAKVGLVLPGTAWRRIADQLVDHYDLANRNVRCFGDELPAVEWFQEPTPLPRTASLAWTGGVAPKA